MGEVSERGVAPTGIGQIAVPVRDLERATAFYRDVLGLPHLFSAPPGMSFFRCGEVRLMLAAPEPGSEEASAGEDGGEDGDEGGLLYYRVGDIGSAHDRLVAAGAAVLAKPHVVHRSEDGELWMGFYRDSEGNRFATMAERAGGGAAP